MLRAPEKRSNHASARRRASRSEAHPHESIGSMSTDKRHVLAAVPAGGGLALDLGGGAGELSSALGGLGYQYVNLDPAARGAGAVAGDAQGTPFRTGAFSLVVSSDSLEHIADPRAALREVRRLLAPEGSFIVWVPFLHPFHGDDYYRYTPLGLRYLLEGEGFRVDRLEAPLWISTVIATALLSWSRRGGSNRPGRGVERAASWLDARLSRFKGPNMSYAAAYLVVARPTAGG